ncbi:MAG: RDD family protein [Rickettsiales bacterium TMED289]|nr:hypothetical protein [Gammaproteobacteria bacterium]RPF74750.1 MAG: RDD family protein [Rickettsiales bacterium TMED289]|tara:strand:+ start:15763 stop:16191 length:429 start_codon:yes stop_codon:yes gene_type:complete
MKNKFIYPGIFSRLMSFTYDIFLVIALWFLFGFIFLGLFKLFSYSDDFFPPSFGITIIVLTTAGYYSYFWSYGRNTLGMSTWGHQIISADGKTITFKTALYRFLLYLALSIIGFSWALFNKQNKTLPDKMLGLVVIKQKSAS